MLDLLKWISERSRFFTKIATEYDGHREENALAKLDILQELELLINSHITEEEDDAGCVPVEGAGSADLGVDKEGDKRSPEFWSTGSAGVPVSELDREARKMGKP
jgi:hypothetical protein